MSYSVEKQYCYITGNPIVDYLVHKCKKSKCKIGTISKCKIWEYDGQVQGISIILKDCLKTYRFLSRYDLNVTSLSQVKTEMSFNYSENITFKNIIEINEAIKIDPTDPINSGLQATSRIKKLLAFS